MDWEDPPACGGGCRGPGTGSRSRSSDVRLTFLGRGTSYGVPQIGCRCRTCTSTDPRDKRTRTAAVIESRGRRLLIETPAPLRLQLVAAGVTRVEAGLVTPDPAQHLYGT